MLPEARRGETPLPPPRLAARLRDGDPLRIGGLCVRCVESRAPPLQIDLVPVQTLLKASVGAVRYEGTPALDSKHGGDPTDPECGLRHCALAAQLGFEPGEERRMAVVFNGLDEESSVPRRRIRGPGDQPPLETFSRGRRRWPGARLRDRRGRCSR